MLPEKEEFEKNSLSEHIHAHPVHHQDIGHILQQNDSGEGVFSWLFSSFNSSSSDSSNSSSSDSTSGCSDLSSSDSSDSSSSLDSSLCSDLLFNIPL